MEKFISNYYRIEKICEKKSKSSAKEAYQNVYFLDNKAIALDGHVAAILDLTKASNLNSSELETLNGKSLDSKSFELVCKGYILSVNDTGITVKSKSKEEVFYEYVNNSIPLLPEFMKKISIKQPIKEISGMRFYPYMKKVCEVLGDSSCPMYFHGNGNIIKITDETIGLEIVFYHKCI